MDVRVIGAPMDLGADRRGVDMGPSAIRYAGLEEAVRTAGFSYNDTGDLPIPNPEGRDPHAERPPSGDVRYLRETRWVTRRVESAVREAVSTGDFPLILGGDHSIAFGSIRGVSQDRDLGVLWLDAHGDFNTPSTSPSGNIHGMVLAGMCGRGEFSDMSWAQSSIDESNIAMVGIRDLDSQEKENLQQSALHTFTMSDIDRVGLVSVIEQALDAVLESANSLHVSLDMDFLDPDTAPGVGTPVSGGATYREAHTAMELVSETDSLRSMEIAEVNPILDSHNRTAEISVELVASALGKQIL